MQDIPLTNLAGLGCSQDALRFARRPLNCLNSLTGYGLNVGAGNARWPTPHATLQAAYVTKALVVAMQSEFQSMTARFLQMLSNSQNQFEREPGTKPRIQVSAEVNQRDTLEIIWVPQEYKPRDANTHWLHSTDFKSMPSIKSQHLAGTNVVIQLLAREWLKPEFDFPVDSELLKDCEDYLHTELAECLDAFLTTLDCLAEVTVTNWLAVSSDRRDVVLTTPEGRAVQRLTFTQKHLKPTFESEDKRLTALTGRAGFTSLQGGANRRRHYNMVGQQPTISKYLFEKRGTRISGLQLKMLSREIAKFLPLRRYLDKCSTVLAQLTATSKN